MLINLSNKWLSRIVTIGVPAAIGILELWHPRYLSIPSYDELLLVVDQWLIIHLLEPKNELQKRDLAISTAFELKKYD